MRKAFLPTAHIEGLATAFISWTLDEYCSRFTGKPARTRRHASGPSTP